MLVYAAIYAAPHNAPTPPQRVPYAICDCAAPSTRYNELERANRPKKTSFR
jgi:hypothetical protein